MALPSFRHLFPLHVFLSPIDTIFTPYCSSSPSSPGPSASAAWLHAAGSVYLGTVEASYEKLLTESSAGAEGESQEMTGSLTPILTLIYVLFYISLCKLKRKRKIIQMSLLLSE